MYHVCMCVCVCVCVCVRASTANMWRVCEKGGGGLAQVKYRWRRGYIVCAVHQKVHTTTLWL